jgi:membrane protease YdiL (CAAX protease family)
MEENMSTQNMKRDPTSNQIYHFFILAFLFSWILWLPGLLMTFDIIRPNQTLSNINNALKWVAGIGPSLAALILISRDKGKIGIKNLFRRVFMYKLGFWYLPLLLLLPCILIFAHFLNFLIFNASFPKTGPLSEPWWIPVLFLVFFVMQFSEELGWRGYALDRLQKKWNAVFSSILLGMIWAIWHVPMFMINGYAQHDYHLPFEQFIITLVLLSIIITWIQNNSKGSLIPAFTIHALINLSGDMLPLIEKNTETQGNYTAWILTNILLGLITIVIVIVWGYKKLVR